MPNVSRNSIEYNLTNKLFQNCKRRFIIDINDSDDVQITSCFETKNDKHVLVNLDDNYSSPKEVKYKLNKGTKGKLQFRTYNLNKRDENIRQAVADLFDHNMATAQISRKTNYLANRSPKFCESSPNQSERRSTSAEWQIQTRSRSKDRSNRNGSNNKSNSFGSIGKSKKVAVGKVTKKRSRSVDHDDDDERSTKRKKIAYKKRATNTVKKSGSNSKESKNTKPKKVQKKANPKPKKKADETANTADNQTSSQQQYELIELESSVESESVNESSSLINSDNRINTDPIASSSNESLNDSHQQTSPTQSIQSIQSAQSTESATLDTEMLARYLASNLLHQRNQQTSEHVPATAETATTSNVPQSSTLQEPSELFQKYLEYQDLENRVKRLKKQNETEINNRRSTLNQSSLKNKQDHEKKKSVYHLDDNLIAVDNKLGVKHLITCLTIIAIGELVHYLQPKASLNYNQLPVGCILIGNIINSVQFTMFGHLLFVLANLVVPKLLSVFRTSSRLICYCLLLFLSYGMLRKSITNWILNNNRLFRLFPLNVSICCTMLILYSIIALYLSTDGNKIVKTKKSSDDLLDGGDSIETKKSSNWFNVIVNILTPYFVISPIIGTNTVRLYNVPKPLLAVSALIYLIGLYKYCVGRLERNPSSKNQKLTIYELKENNYLFSSSSRVRYLTLFGALLMITAYNLLVLNLWSFLLEFFVLIYLKFRTYHQDKQFAKLNKSVYNRYRSNNPYTFSSWVH